MYRIILVSIIWIVPSLVLAQGSGPDARSTDVPVPADAGVSATSIPVAAPMATIVVTPRPVLTTVVPIPTPRPSPVSEQEPKSQNFAGEQSTSLSEDWFYKYAVTLFGVGGIATLAYGFFKFQKSKNNKNEKDSDGKCGSIRELLEQKKKELEEMVKNWPEKKIKGMAQDKILGELKKDEDAKKIIETAENLKAKYDQLNKTIEMLQKKYDLCMMELPPLAQVKTLKFKGFKAKSIIDGSKTATMRLFDDKDLKKDDDLELVNSDDGKVFAEAVIIDVVHKSLREVDIIDLDGHEKWSSKEEMLESLKKYYGNNINLDTMAKIVRFKLVKKD